MDRRNFLVGVAASFVVRAHAQPLPRTSGIPRVGIYITSPLESLQRHYVTLFFEEMRELGWLEGSTVAYERAYPLRELKADEMLRHAQELVARKPDVIWLASSISAEVVVLKLNHSIPVVGGAVSGVVERGLAKSLAHPGGNFTGISNFAWELGDKRYELLHEMLPKLARVGVLLHPANRNCLRELKLIEEAAARSRVTVIRAAMAQEDQLSAAFYSLRKNAAEAILIAHHPLFQTSRKDILKLAAELRIPAIGHRSYFADDGALMAYSTVLDEQMRRSAHLVDKILKGTPAGEIPVEQPTKFELVINRRTARTLGLVIPQSLLIQADRIIE